MATDETDRTEDTSDDEGAAEAALDSQLDALVGLGEEADDETEATESEAEGEAPESPADEAEEAPAPPTAESLGYNLKDPKDKAAYEAMVKEWGKWTNRFHAKLKTKPEQPAETPPPPPAEAQGEAWDPYTVPLDKFVYDGGKESEDSVLSGAEADIDRRIQKGVAEGIKFALNEMRNNDARLRQQQQIGTAQERIAAYADALQAHPDWEEKAPLVSRIAARTKDLAIEDPDEWIAMVEARTGIMRNWRDETPPARQPQRPSKSPLANVPRSTNGARVVGNSNARRTDMDPKEAAEYNYNRVFGH